MMIGAQEVRAQEKIAAPESVRGSGFLDSELWALDHYHLWEQAFRDAIRFNPKNGLAQHLLGKALLKQRRYEESERCLRIAIRLNPDDLLARYHLAFAFRAEGKMKECERECREIVRQKPDDPVALEALATALELQGETQLALEVWGRALGAERDPKELQRMRGNLARMTPILEKSLKKEGLPSSPPPFHKKVDREKEGMNTEGRAYCGALRMDPELSLARYEEGTLLWEREKWAQAERAFRGAIRFNPGFYQAHHMLGASLWEQGKRAEAERAFREAVRLKPHLAEARYSLGRAFYEQGKYEEAERKFREILQGPGIDPVAQFFAHLGLGDVLWKQGRFREAEEASHNALQIGADPELKELLATSGFGRKNGRRRESKEMDLSPKPFHQTPVLQRPLASSTRSG